MKLLLLTAYFPPEIGSASHLFYELAESLVKRGYNVSVVTGFPEYHVKGDVNKYKREIFLKEAVNGMEVIRIKVLSLFRNIPVFRGLWQFSSAFSLFIGGLFLGRQDFIAVYSPPLPLCISAYLLSRIKGIPFLINLQDIFPQSAIDLGVLKNRFLVGLFGLLEKFVYVKADYITVHSEGNRRYVLGRSKKIDPDKVTVIPNWVDTDIIKPGSRDNEFRREHFLNGKFIVSFAGIMGYSQDMEVMIDSAGILKDYKDILFLMVGDGARRKEAEEEVRKQNLTNVKFLPMQARDKYPEVLRASDACLVTLKKEVRTPVVPSKILGIMSAGKPVVASLNREGDAPALIRDADCGYCVDPGNHEELAKTILELYNNRNLCDELGRNGRLYAEKFLSRDICVNKYEEILRCHSE